jgi:hypothetical protein
MSEVLEKALRLQLVHIEVWMEGDNQTYLAPFVLRAVHQIATDALAKTKSVHEESVCK